MADELKQDEVKQEGPKQDEVKKDAAPVAPVLTPAQHVQNTHLALASAHMNAAAQQLQAGSTPEVVAIHLKDGIEHAQAALAAVEDSAHAAVDTAHGVALAVSDKVPAAKPVSQLAVAPTPATSHTVAWVLGTVLAVLAAVAAAYAKTQGAW